jgi:hypothetical protein
VGLSIFFTPPLKSVPSSLFRRYDDFLYQLDFYNIYAKRPQQDLSTPTYAELANRGLASEIHLTD